MVESMLRGGCEKEKRRKGEWVGLIKRGRDEE